MSVTRLFQRPILAIYGVYSVTCLAIVVAGALVLVTFPLKIETRRKITSRVARLWLTLTGVRLIVEGREHLDTHPAVAVANHASYIDGIILNGVLPPHFGFVIKREVTRTPFLHFLLRRIGAYFVERRNRYQGGRDARQILDGMSAGGSVAIFPEGTFSAVRGLAAFRTGAFAAAVAGQVPVIPIVITGARQILPAGRWLPRPGHLHIRVLAPIPCEGDGRDAMRQLADLSRTAILAHLDEPDLLGEKQATDTIQPLPN